MPGIFASEVNVSDNFSVMTLDCVRVLVALENGGDTKRRIRGKPFCEFWTFTYHLQEAFVVVEIATGRIIGRKRP
jgi:hypothetical protein